MTKRSQINDRSGKRVRRPVVVRFEVRALRVDQALIRAIAKRLMANDERAQELRAYLRQRLTVNLSKRGQIWRTLRKSPLVGSGVTFKRERSARRKVYL